MNNEFEEGAEKVYRDVLRFGMIEQDLSCNEQWIKSVYRMGYELGKKHETSNIKKAVDIARNTTKVDGKHIEFELSSAEIIKILENESNENQ